MTMKKGYFSIDGKKDLNEIFEGYTDGALWNGWACVTFTREQMEKWLQSSPYDYRFVPMSETIDGPTNHVIIYFEDETTIESTPLVIENGDLVEGYYMACYCFVEMKKIDEDNYEIL